jgi:hypothetical protein
MKGAYRMGKTRAIEIPADFKESYLAAKNKAVTDKEIAEGLFIDLGTLAKWKRLAGFKAGDFAHLKSRRVRSERNKKNR